MRKVLFLFTFFAVAGLFGPAAKEAAAQCTHLGGQGTCPVGIPNGSSSVSFGPNGTINWDSGGVSGACCAEPSGTETGAGLFNLNNALGGGSFRFGPTTAGGTSGPGSTGLLGDDDVTLTGENFQDFGRVNCDIGGCDGGGLLGDVFGANPNSGYLCDSGGGGCGSDQWVGLPQPGFGDCGPGGCTGPAPVQPLNFGALTGSGRYSQNLTQGEVDPFGGGSSFQDPVTGQAIDLPDNEAEWPDHVKHADKLNSAYVNDEIPYPFDDPNWRDKSAEDFANEPPPGLSNSSQPIIPSGLADIYIPTGAPGGGRLPDQAAYTYVVQPGDTFEEISRKTGLSIRDLKELNGFYENGFLMEGQGFRIPPLYNIDVNATLETSPSSPPTGDTNFSGKPGRFGIGADTSLGGGGLPPTGSQAAGNFGIQNIINFTRVDINTENPNADLTNYVNTVVTAIDASRRPKGFVSVLPAVTPAPAAKPAEENTEEAPEPQSTSVNLRIGGWESLTGIDRIDTEGQATVFRVSTTDRRTLDFKSRDDAFLFSDRLNRAGSGKTYNEVVGELPSGRGPINVGPVNTDAVDALTENIPNEFRAPKVNTIRVDGFLIRDPQTGREIEVKSAAERDAVLNAMRNGATLEQAAEIAKNAPVVTPDGLASATTSRSPKSTSSTPAPAGSTVTFTDNRPAIIVRPTRPEGTNVGSMKGVLQGQAYDIEVIRAENGKVYAVGTGENASHIFGEVKESSNKLFGDWRREGPWTPPPAKTTATATATPGAQAPAPQPTPPSQAANNRVRSQIANSDRDYLLKTGGFAPGDALNWTSTER
jgi:LysM repeat protein